MTLISHRPAAGSVVETSASHPLPTYRPPLSLSADDTATAAVDTDAVITLAAVPAASHVLAGVAWSYATAPTGGLLTIEDGSGTTVFSLDVTAAGPGSIAFPVPLKGTVNTALIVTLAGAGAAVVGTVNLLGHWTE